MHIRRFPSGPFSTNCYIISCPDTRRGAIIDPSPDSLQHTIAYIEREGIIPEMILLTHSHWDHFKEAKALKEHFNIPLYVHRLDAPNVERPGADGLPLMMPIEATKAEKLLEDGDKITLGTLTLEVIHTPGHSPGGVCYWVAQEKSLFSGDTLFKGTIGNVSFPTSEPEKMWVSLKNLSRLDPETKVYPGHGPSTTIGAETWLSNAQHYFGD
jgi:hydroxyacylglutathione hydrolase